MADRKHIIKRQLIELEIPSGLDSSSIQERVAHLFHEKIVPLIDRFLSEKYGQDTITKMEHLELDLGRIPLSKLEDSLMNEIESELQHKLPALPMDAGKAAVKKENAGNKGRSDLDAIVYFLQTGVLPWWAAETSLNFLEKALEDLIKNDASLLKAIVNKLFREAFVLKRFMYTFSDKIHKRLIEIYLPGADADIKDLESELFALFKDKLSAREFRETFWYFLFETCVYTPAGPEGCLPETALRVFAHLVKQKNSETDPDKLLHYYQNQVDLLKQIVTHKFPSAGHPYLKQAEMYLQEIISSRSARSGEKLTGNIPEQNEAAPEIISIDDLHKKALPENRIKTDQPEKLYDPFCDTDKLFINNAGIVLLWPFLNRFFINIDLADDKEFKDPAAAERACYLLQYLTEGKADDIFEAQLPLNKVLCGIDLEQPLDTRIALSPDEVAAGEHFLQAVIQHGPLWKDISVDSFRQAYLKREGALSTRDGMWLLQVKRETYDVIVDQLPWSVQVVKLPWMKNLIFVEWQQM